jgi:hypothetical protein
MRDIRSDLQDRINFLGEQISTAHNQFEQHLEQMKHEHDSRLKDLKAELQAVNTLMDGEHRRLGGAAAAPQQVEPQRGRPQMRLSDFLVRKLSDGGTMSMEDLRHLAIQEGYFADDISAEPALRETLTQIVNAGFVRQLPNGSFALPTVTHMIGLRRAV